MQNEPAFESPGAYLNRVFITQHSRNRDFTDARKFGPLIFFTGIEIWPDSWESDIFDARADINGIMERYNFHPKNDYVLLSGDPVIIAMVINQITSKWPTANLKLLKFDRKEDGYVPIKI